MSVKSEVTVTPAKKQTRRRRYSLGIALDWFFFIFAGLSAVWLAVLSINETFHTGWWGIVFLIVFWAVLAYLVLPRFHRILTTIYVPDYFIGRTRTSDGLLGDPINLALLGDEAQVRQAMLNAGWTQADPVTLGSSLRIIASTLTRRSYDEAPVSPLFLFGRQQDFAFQQEVDGNPAQRHHVRFWRCPPDWPLPGGRRVQWLAAGTFDKSVGLSLFTLQVTHKIDANTDIERDHIVESLEAANPNASIEVIVDFSTGYHARNGGGDSIRTDGSLPVVDLREVSVVDPELLEAVVESSSKVEPDLEADAVGSGLAGSDDASQHPDATSKQVSANQDYPAKRAAFESPASLIRPVKHDPTMKRPASVTAGAGLVLLRAIAGALWLVSFMFEWGEFSRSVEFDDILEPAELSGLFWTILGVTALFVLIEFVLAFFVWRGNNLARVLVMAYSTASIVISFSSWLWQGQEITIGTTLFTLAFDILVLLALSSRDAAAYSRRFENTK